MLSRASLPIAALCCLSVVFGVPAVSQSIAIKPLPSKADGLSADGHLVRSVIVGTEADPLTAALPSRQVGIAGGAWTTLSTGLNAVANAIAVHDSDVYVGGFFTDAGGTTANYVARWDGTRWHSLGSGVNGPHPAVYGLATSGDSLYAGGVFVSAGGQSSRGIARWDGSNWHSMAGGVDGSVFAIAVDGSSVYAGGYFNTAGGAAARNIARWDGTTWQPLGAGLNNVVRSLAVYEGNLIAAGDFDSTGSASLPYIARWNGSTWEPLGGGTDYFVYSMAVDGHKLYAGGVFLQAGGVPANYIAQWDGSSWQSVGQGVNNIVYALAVSPQGVYLGGLFTQAGQLYTNQTARWDGTAWSAQSGGVNNVVFATAANGTNAYFGGAFSVAGAQPAARIAAWHEVNSTVFAVLPGWNLVSLPRKAANTDASLLFPGHRGAVFAYNTSSQGYDVASTLTVGAGYWVKYDASTAITISGSDVDSIAVATVQSGWALLGSLTSTLPSTLVATDPSGVLTSSVFRFNRSTQSYEPSSEITPGEGYWVKVTAPASIHVP
ncbi:MAG TPA: hypothetical protein VMG09_16505 [Bacteroidota bacterium]|nr:hypothetical protein [Bacteroidota bacterium]